MSDILYEKHETIVTITMNRPDKMNAINKAVREGLRESWTRFEQDDRANVAILTAAGERAFSAGADLKEMSEQEDSFDLDQFPMLGQNVHVSKPVIAAVNGIAVGGGFMFAQMCDLCVAAEEARFGITEARWGRGAPWAIPLLAMIPKRIMMEILMTAEPVSAQRAYEVGFVNRVVPREKLMDEAIALAETISSNAPLTVRAYKQMIEQGLDIMGQQAARDVAGLTFDPVYESEDAQEGPQAFAEGRDPQWKGR